MDAVEMGRYVRELKTRRDQAIEDALSALREMDDVIQDLKYAICYRGLDAYYQDSLRKKHPGAYSLLMAPCQERGGGE